MGHARRHRGRVTLLSRLVFTGDSGGSNPRLWSGHPEAVQIAVHQSVEKIPEHSVTNRRGLAFRQAFSQKTLGFCAIRVGSFVENSGTRTTFLLRSPKTEKEQPLTHRLKRELAPRARFELATLRLTGSISNP
jgi:hypothetical protein